MRLVDMIARRSFAGVLCVILVGYAGGCGSSPSVVPLLNSVQRVLEQEAELVNSDAERQRGWLEQQKKSLQDGFGADLSAREKLDAVWVKDHTDVYVAAREALVEHEMRCNVAFGRRLENLAAAKRAQERAVGLIEEQDRLFERVPDLRRWLLKSGRADGMGGGMEDK